MERIERIKDMEQRLDMSRQALDGLEEALAVYESVQEDYQTLCDYYESHLWMEDFEADEAGKLPPELKRGVLSEDVVYDLITDNHDLMVRMLKVITGELENKTRRKP